LVTDVIRDMRDQLSGVNESAHMAMLTASQTFLKFRAGENQSAVNDLSRAVVELQDAYEKAARCAIFGMKALQNQSSEAHAVKPVARPCALKYPRKRTVLFGTKSRGGKR